MNIEIFISVTSFWGDDIIRRICSCVAIFKTCNSPITSVFWPRISKSFTYRTRQKIGIKHCFEDDVMLVMVDTMILTYFWLFFGKYQNNLAFSATFHFLLSLGTMNYSDSNDLGVISSEVGGIWWHQKFNL